MKTDFLTDSYLALREKLLRNALKFLQDEEDAKDALQDAYINLRSGSRINSGSEAGNKLFITLRNRCLDILRKRKRHSPLFEDIPETTESQTEEDIDRYEQLLVSDLSEQQLEIYRLIVQEGMEYKKVAELTGKSIQSVRTEMCRLRKKIQATIKRMDA